MRKNTNDLQSFHAWAWDKFGPCVTWQGLTLGLQTDRFTVTALNWQTLKRLANEADNA